MPKYTADHYEVRVATTELGLDSASPLSSWESIEINVEHGRQKVPVGIGSRLQEVHAGLLDYSGTFTGWYDEGAVAGSSNILVAFGMFQQSELTPLYFRIANKVSGKTVTLKKVTGDPSFTLGSPEEFAMWSWDFDFEDMAYS